MVAMVRNVPPGIVLKFTLQKMCYLAHLQLFTRVKFVVVRLIIYGPGSEQPPIIY